MKILNQNIHESNFFEEDSALKVEVNAVTFEVLSSSLYKDKPLAIVRELFCNAVDATKQAKSDRPVKVHLPAVFDETFSIEDWGTGIPHPLVKNLAMVFFASDKRNSNELIGGMGLGMKTPLAYTNSFTIRSRYAGEESTHFVYKENGEPKCRMICLKDTSEPNGVKIEFVVGKEDITRFKAAARSVLKHFPSSSYTVNLDVQEEQYIYETQFYKVPLSGLNGYYGSPIACMGNVMYEVDKDKLTVDVYDPDGLGATRNLVTFAGLVVNIPMGRVSVQASREGLSYDDRTIKELNKRFSVLSRLMARDAKAVYESDRPFLEKVRILKAFPYRYSASHMQEMRKGYGEGMVETSLSMSTYSDLTKLSKGPRNPIPCRVEMEELSRLVDKMIFIDMSPVGCRGSTTVMSVLKELREMKQFISEDTRFVFVRGTTSYLRQLTSPGQWVDFDDLPFVPRKRPVRVQEDLEAQMRVYHGKFASVAVQVEKLTLDRTVYVRTNKGDVLNYPERCYVTHSNEQLLGILEKYKILHVVYVSGSETKLKRLLDKGGAVPLATILGKAAEEFFADPGNRLKFSLGRRISAVTTAYNKCHDFVEYARDWVLRRTPQIYQDLVQAVEEGREAKDFYTSNALMEEAPQKELVQTHELMEHSIFKTCGNFLEAYPLLNTYGPYLSLEVAEEMMIYIKAKYDSRSVVNVVSNPSN